MRQDYFLSLKKGKRKKRNPYKLIVLNAMHLSEIINLPIKNIFKYGNSHPLCFIAPSVNVKTYYEALHAEGAVAAL